MNRWVCPGNQSTHRHAHQPGRPHHSVGAAESRAVGGVGETQGARGRGGAASANRFSGSTAGPSRSSLVAGGAPRARGPLITGGAGYHYRPWVHAPQAFGWLFASRRADAYTPNHWRFRCTRTVASAPVPANEAPPPALQVGTAVADPLPNGRTCVPRNPGCRRKHAPSPTSPPGGSTRNRSRRRIVCRAAADAAARRQQSS